MRQGWLGAVRRRIAIVLVVFGRGGIVFGNIRRFELIMLGEELRSLGYLTEIDFYDLLHLLEF